MGFDHLHAVIIDLLLHYDALFIHNFSFIHASDFCSITNSLLKIY